MILYLLLAVVTILTAWFVHNDAEERIADRQIRMSRQELVNKICLSAVFVILFIPSALRFNVGNDYYTYVNRFHELSFGGYTEFEPGNALLVRIVYGLTGFECYELVFAIFAAVTLFLFLKVLCEQTTDFFTAFALFMLQGMYFQTYNTVRYYLALAVAVFSLRFVLRKQYLRFILVIVAAAFFHKSVLIVIPIYLLATIRWKWWMAVIGTLLASTGLIFGDFYQKILLKLYPSYEDTPFLEGGTSYVQLAKCVLILAVGIVFYKKAVRDDEAMRLYFNLNVMALLLYVFGSFIPVISRIGYYMTFTQILFITQLLRKLREEKYYKWLRILVLAGAVLYFGLFLKQCYSEELKLLPYGSWLFENERIQFEYPMLYME